MNPKKISTSGTTNPLQGDVFSALENLDTTALPAGISPTPIIPPKPAEGKRGRLILRREKKERGGKTVVVIYGFDQLPGWNPPKLEELSRLIRKKMGCGGCVEKREIVVQGDQATRVAEFLEQEGFRVDGVR